MARDRGPLTASASSEGRANKRTNSLVAAAQVLMRPGRAAAALAPFATTQWQAQAWEFYDTVGELGFGVDWLGNGMSRVNIVAARPGRSAGDDPTPLSYEDENLSESQRRALDLVAAIAGGAQGQGEMMRGIGTHLAVTGISWIVAEPEHPDEADPEYDATAEVYAVWNVYSAEELRRPIGNPTRDLPDGTKQPVVEVQYDEGKWRKLHPNALLVRCWTRHPRRGWEPNAPTKRSLTVLTLIDTLTKRMHADGISRLAGAGLLLMPTEATFPPNQRRIMNLSEPTVVESEVDQPADDDFAETFTEYGIVPIGDRSSPAAVVPLVARIPGEYVDKVKHLTFSTPFDQYINDALDRAIRRLALGMDLPPEVLLGLADVNHWNGWLVAENAVKLHIEPKAETACLALTMGYLHPALEAEGLATSDVVVWFDTGDLTDKPDNSANAAAAYDKGELSAKGLLEEMNLPQDLAPTDDERRVRILLDMAKAVPALAPAILVELGLMSADTAALAAPAPAPAPSEPPAQVPAPDGPPDTPQDPPGPSGGASTDGLVAACDQIVYRALERSGNRLRSAIGRKVTGGAASVDCTDATRLHLVYDPTVYDDLDHLLEGAWAPVAAVAHRHGLDEEVLRVNLSAYTRAVLASQQPHSYDRLAASLGVNAAV
jgi:hypothetical protein